MVHIIITLVIVDTRTKVRLTILLHTACSEYDEYSDYLHERVKMPLHNIIIVLNDQYKLTR